MQIIVTGNPVDGLTFIGPFPDGEVSEDFLEPLDEWWIAALGAPEQDEYYTVKASWPDLAHRVEQALALIDDDPDFDSARENDRGYPLEAHRLTVTALRNLRDALNPYEATKS